MMQFSAEELQSIRKMTVAKTEYRSLCERLQLLTGIPPCLAKAGLDITEPTKMAERALSRGLRLLKIWRPQDRDTLFMYFLSGALGAALGDSIPDMATRIRAVVSELRERFLAVGISEPDTNQRLLDVANHLATAEAAFASLEPRIGSLIVSGVRNRLKSLRFNNVSPEEIAKHVKDTLQISLMSIFDAALFGSYDASKSFAAYCLSVAKYESFNLLRALTPIQLLFKVPLDPDISADLGLTFIESQRSILFTTIQKQYCTLALPLRVETKGSKWLLLDSVGHSLELHIENNSLHFRRRLSTVTTDFAPADDDERGFICAPPTATGLSPEGKAQLEQFYAVFTDSLDHLPPHRRQVIELKIEQWTEKDINNLFGWTSHQTWYNKVEAYRAIMALLRCRQYSPPDFWQDFESSVIDQMGYVQW